MSAAPTAALWIIGISGAFTVLSLFAYAGWCIWEVRRLSRESTAAPRPRRDGGGSVRIIGIIAAGVFMLTSSISVFLGFCWYLSELGPVHTLQIGLASVQYMVIAILARIAASEFGVWRL